MSVSLSPVGNIGGQPYWSWDGFSSRVEWCACFVSWCANECGYIETGVIPKFAGCVNGVQWFKDRGQWMDGSAEPVPGMIIFFDWEGDGETDHTGIVQKCENGTVYTVEGNSGHSGRTKNIRSEVLLSMATVFQPINYKINYKTVRLKRDLTSYNTGLLTLCYEMLFMQCSVAYFCQEIGYLRNC